jgi:alpha-L-rhamnosidase
MLFPPQTLWLQDPRFDGLAPLDPLGRYREREAIARRVLTAHRPGLANVHMLLRKRFTLDDVPRAARLRLTADDYAKVWVNGHFVGQGPAPGFVWQTFVSEWDVAPYLREGENVLAVHVYYQGMISRVWNSADQRMGLAAALEITGADGATATIVSDASWRSRIVGKPTTVTVEDHFRRRSPEEYYLPSHSGGMIGSLTAFQENWDARELPAGWREPGFDDGEWGVPSAVALAETDYTFMPQPTPPLEHRRLAPAAVRTLGPGHYLLDFGHALAGTVGLRLPGRDGHVVELRHAEELEPDGTARYRTRCNCVYQEFWTLSGAAECVLEPFDYKGFRYVEVLGATAPLSAANAWVDIRHYPLPEDIHFSSTDPLLDRIWRLCTEALTWCGQEGSVDCPNREKGQYLGDMPHFLQTHVRYTGDTRLMRKALGQFAATARVIPGLLCIAPGTFNFEIADFSLLFPEQVEFLYWQTGDRTLLDEFLPVAEGVLAHYGRFADAHGLITIPPGEAWDLVDHPYGTMTDGYDRKDGEPHAVMNLLWYGAHAAVARLRQWAGLPPADNAPLRCALQEAFVAPGQGGFVDRRGSSHTSLHANALALYVGAADAAAKPAVLSLLANKRMACGPHLAYFLLHALFREGQADLAYSLMAGRDPNSWAAMLDQGATAAMEVWRLEQKANATWCHSWAVTPIALLIHYVLGLTPAAPGWTALRLAPHPPAALAGCALQVRLPNGITAEVDYATVGGRRRYRLRLDQEMPVIAPAAAQPSPLRRVGAREWTLECPPARNAAPPLWRAPSGRHEDS